MNAEIQAHAMDLQKQLSQAAETLNISDQTLQFLGQNIRRHEITLKDVASHPVETKMYKSIGTY